MSKKTEQDRFTQIAGDLLLTARDLVNWGMDTGNTTPDMMRLTVTARKEAAVKLIEGGMSQRQAAKMLGVGVATINRDVSHDGTKSVPERNTGSAATKARRAAVATKISAAGVTEAPTSKYRIVYADPPWSYDDTTLVPHRRGLPAGDATEHYPTMELAAICALPVKEWVEDDAVLFLWVTAPMTLEAGAVVDAWGFKFKSEFIWDKIKHNMGHYSSVRHEKLYVCTRGSCQPDVKQLFDSVQSIERSDKHSAKPVEFYDIIETLYTHGRKLEMFARVAREGWDVYGHQAELSEAG